MALLLPYCWRRMGDIPVELLEIHILLLGVDHIPDSEIAVAVAVAVDYDVDDVDAVKQQ